MSDNAGTQPGYVTGGVVSYLLAEIRNYGSLKFSEGRGAVERETGEIRSAWDRVYSMVQILASQQPESCHSSYGSELKLALDRIVELEYVLRDVRSHVNGGSGIKYGVEFRMMFERIDAALAGGVQKQAATVDATRALELCDAVIHSDGSRGIEYLIRDKATSLRNEAEASILAVNNKLENREG